jgi:hypothetical protein
MYVHEDIILDKKNRRSNQKTMSQSQLHVECRKVQHIESNSRKMATRVVNWLTWGDVRQRLTGCGNIGCINVEL